MPPIRPFQEWANTLGLNLAVKNSGEHWIFTAPGVLFEWWPSTGRFVHDKNWSRALKIKHPETLKRRISALLPPPQIRPAHEEYLEILVEGF